MRKRDCYHSIALVDLSDGVWIAGKPPSEEVADLLTRYGVTHREPSGPQPEPLVQDDDRDWSEAPRPPGEDETSAACYAPLIKVGARPPRCGEVRGHQ